MKQCPQCRRTYSDETLSFCLEDGSPLVAQINSEITQRYVPAITEQFETPRGTAQPTPNTFQIAPAFSQPPSPPKRSNFWIIPVVAVLLLLITGGGVAAFLLLKNNSGESPDSNVRTIASNTAANITTNTASNTPSNTAANTSSNIASNTATPERSTISPTLNKPPSAKLVGTWIADVKEQGVKMRITYVLNDDGTSKAFFKTSDGRTGNDGGTWRFSDDILYEKFSDGAAAKGLIKMIDEDTFEITIIDNGTPAYTGVKRLYHRKK